MSRRDDEPMNIPDDEMFRAEWDVDGHVNEDTVHAWLDRQLAEGDSSAVELHVATCAECAELVAEARGLKAATTRIVASLDVVAGGIVPREDVARTASHIVALANAAEKSERARVAVAKKKFWQNPVVLRAAAAVVVMVGGTTLVMREYSPTSMTSVSAMDSSVAAPVASAPFAPNTPASNPSTASATSGTAAELNKASAVVADAPARQAPRPVAAVDSTDAPRVAFKRPAEVEKNLKEEALAKSARAETEQRASVIANADSSVAKKMSDAVGRGAVVNTGSAAPPAAISATSRPVSPSAPARVLAETMTSADKSRADSAVAAGAARAFSGKSARAAVGGGGRAAGGVGSLNTLRAMSDTPAASKSPITIVGTVRDSATGRALPGVLVMVRGIPIGTVTSTSGTFILKEVPRNADSLMARRIGYQSAVSTIAITVNDTAHAAFNLRTSTPALEEVTTAKLARAQTTAAACELRVVPASANSQPIFRLLLGQFATLGNQPLTVVGWPTPSDTVATTMNRTQDRLSFRALKNGAQLDVQLTKVSAGWRGTAEGRSGSDSRKENIELTTNGAASCAK
ncbi:MAG: carboxypeptidase-like regulatory domain-containing protein [Gemmatimonadaceae bacterium]